MVETIDKGHHYLLDNNKSSGAQSLIFFKDAKINNSGYSGTSNQEVCRALIKRILFLNQQKEAKENKVILYHLRQVIFNHELRALRLKKHISQHNAEMILKEYLIKNMHIHIEDLPVGIDGHLTMR